MGIPWSHHDDDYSDDSLYSEDEEEIDSVLDAVDNICLDSATDAVNAVASTPTSTMPITLNLNQVLLLEEELDLYEKVSVAFLLYDDPALAHQEINKLVRGGQNKPMLNWVSQHSATFQEWQEKFVEAVCIIQNYQILKNLGYEQKDLNERFLPHHSFASLYVNKVKKLLYHLCEDLTQADAEKLLKLVMTDFHTKSLDFKIFDSLYLELYLLHWEEIGYIKQDNLNNLCSILKKMEYFDWCDRLKQLVPPVTVNQLFRNSRNDEPLTVKNKSIDSNTGNKQNKKSDSVFENILNETSLMDLMSLESMISADAVAQTAQKNNAYVINPNNPGFCLIINQEDFYTEIDEKYKHLLPAHENKLESRKGTEKDKRDLEATFKMFNFKTEVLDNLTHAEVTTKITEVLKKITDETSLFICIMSHGDEGVIYGVNSCRVKVRNIQNLMCTVNRTNLLGKPKILILQSCQGTRCQKIYLRENYEDDVTTDGPSSSRQGVIPPRADLFTFWATVPGYGAIRDKRTGSWFIQALCENMKKYGNAYHFEDICTAVIDDVSSKKWSQKSKDVAMVPLKDSTLRKLFYLPPIKNT